MSLLLTLHLAALVTITPQETPLAARRGQTLAVPVRFQVAAGYHINSNKPTLDYLIPTRLEWAASGLKHVRERFPPAQLKSFRFAPEQKLAVYEGAQALESRFAVPPGAPLGRLTLAGRLHYQACDDRACYPPASVNVLVPVEILHHKDTKDTKKNR